MTMDVDIPAPPVPFNGFPALDNQNHNHNADPSSSCSAEKPHVPFPPYRLKSSPDADLELPKPKTEWTYDMRHGMQNVAPYLWLGSSSAAREISELKLKRVSHILILRDPREASYVRPMHPTQFCYHIIEMHDDQNQRIIAHFNPAIEFIQQAIQKNGTVLVYCHTGITLSPTIVIAYIMAAYRKTTEEAIAHVQAHRYCLSVKPNFGKQLREWQAIYQAKLAVSASESSAQQGPKRRVDDMEQDEETVTNEGRTIRKMPANSTWIKDGKEMGDYRPYG
ncbi:protein-tyrosine phosphatase-like protein [Filobasidium floriforme]|uniref:protein-tyrosine phosphatase-like protein n=1 Tax=Filobasidium floriforme TaxID=5210 RepID=UPI001E8D9C74|nr:protein-tyrosine phosphatase-like protein [Filobasidium floriforme]KAH8088040.1 protein-tyrosine phosphatase-like protein [Filobasidium floriforme]